MPVDTVIVRPLELRVVIRPEIDSVSLDTEAVKIVVRDVIRVVMVGVQGPPGARGESDNDAVLLHWLRI